MHIEKYNKKSVYNMLAHYERHPRIYRTQEHINPELKQSNYTLGSDPLTGFAKYKKILETPGLKVMNREDVNVMCDLVVTIPRAFPVERHEEFFRITVDYFLKLLCNNDERWLIGAYVHCDETKDDETQSEDNKLKNPSARYHLHFSWVPAVLHKGQYKVCASQVVNRQLLKKLHGDFSRYMESYFGFDVGILNGATKEGNLTVPQLKEQSKKYNELIQINEKLQNENEQLKLELAENMHNLKIWQESNDITPDFEYIKA